jgi:hypothetical protein
MEGGVMRIRFQEGETAAGNASQADQKEVMDLAEGDVDPDEESFAGLFGGLPTMKKGALEVGRGSAKEEIDTAEILWAAITSQARVSAIRTGSGRMEQLAFPEDGSGQRGLQVEALVELGAGPDEDVLGDPEAAEREIGGAAVEEAGRCFIGNDDHEVIALCGPASPRAAEPNR